MWSHLRLRHLAVVVGCIATCAGIYYSFAEPWIDVPASTWMTWVGGIATGMFLLGAVVYYFGRRAANKVSTEDPLAHLAVLDVTDREATR